MKVARIHIRGWMASFRYPAFISGFQPTLPVPPLSTIYGLLSAAVGDLITPGDFKVGYVFQSQGKAVDLETIYELDESALKAKSNVVKRELLFEPELYLYSSERSFAEHFRMPAWPLLLGRSTDPAMVVSSEIIELEEKSNVRIGGSIFPFDAGLGVTGILQALPTHFTDDTPRRALGTRPFCLVETDFSGRTQNKRPQIYRQSIPYDTEKDWGVFLHG